MRSFLRARAEPYADDIRTDAMGNLIVFKKGRKSTGSKLLLAAHMDEVGLIIRSVTDEGYLKFSAVAGSTAVCSLESRSGSERRASRASLA